MLADEILKGHMVQGRQGVCSTKAKAKDGSAAQPDESLPPDIKIPYVDPEPTLLQECSNEMHVRVFHTSKLYTENTG